MWIIFISSSFVDLFCVRLLAKLLEHEHEKLDRCVEVSRDVDDFSDMMMMMIMTIMIIMMQLTMTIAVMN